MLRENDLQSDRQEFGSWYYLFHVLVIALTQERNRLVEFILDLLGHCDELAGELKCIIISIFQFSSNYLLLLLLLKLQLKLVLLFCQIFQVLLVSHK